MPQHIKSKITGEVIHIIQRFSELQAAIVAPYRDDIVDPQHSLQVATIKQDAGKTYRPHMHVINPRFNHQTCESWVVLSGAVRVWLYDIDGSILANTILRERDASITLMGGHNYEIREDNTIVLEYKSGPFNKFVEDKKFIQ